MSEPRTVLVVEDDTLAREAIADAFQDMGLQVVEAVDGTQALAIINARPTLDALFTDIVMGDGPDGWDVADAFRVFYPAAPVLYGSGYAPSQIRRVPLSLYFAKPYNIPDLGRTLLILVGGGEGHNDTAPWLGMGPERRHLVSASGS